MNNKAPIGIDDKLRILFLCESLNIGGAEKALLSILKGLPDFNIDLKLISATGGFMRELYESQGIKWSYCIKPGNSAFNSFFNSVKVKLIYKWLPSQIVGNYLCRNYDVVVAFCEGYLTKWVAASSVNCKKIAWVHTDMVNNDWPVKTGVFHDIEEEKRAYLKFDHVIGVSNLVSAGMMSKFGLKDVSTIYNLLDDSIANKALKTVDYRPTCRLNFVSVGRLEPVKGYGNLIEAIGLLVNEHKLDISLCLVGDGSQRAALEHKVKLLNLDDRITFAGSQSNPYPFIRVADVYICSSLQEGFNIAILEAMTLGKPIIATDSAGPHEILDGDKYGLLVENSINGIAEGISRFYHNENLKSQYSKMSSERVKDFSTETQITKIKELIGIS